MTASLLISQSPEAIASDLAALNFRSAAPTEDAPVPTVLWDGEFLARTDASPRNIFAMLAAAQHAGETLSAWRRIYFGRSVNMPNPAWTWALMAKLVERLADDAIVSLPFAAPSVERQGLLAWAGIEASAMRSGAPVEPAVAASWELVRNRILRSFRRDNRRGAPPAEPAAPQDDDLELPARLVRDHAVPRSACWSMALDRFLEHLLPALAGGSPAPVFDGPEIVYLFHGGACRAHGIARAAATALAARPGLHLVDLGAAFGLMSIYWMLLDERITAATAVDRAEKYIPPGVGLGDAILPSGRSIDFVNRSIEQFAFAPPVDVVAFIHALHWVSPDGRADIIKRALAALPADGIIVLNETIRSKVPATKRFVDHAIEFSEILDLRRLAPHIVVYAPRDRWQAPTPIEQVDPDSWTTEHVLVIRKA